MKDFKLNKKDYLSILNFYNINTKNLKTNDIKNTAVNLLVTKLCRCIKKVDKNNNNKNKNKNKNKNNKKTNSIGICKNSVLTKKKLHIYKFSCKKDKHLTSKNKKTKKKTNQNIFKNAKYI
tara:strand:- start:568 stop:930 length:363 start_codon:yes stop_codon:yes gene_type:complete